MINRLKIIFFNRIRTVDIFSPINKFVDYFIICESLHDHRGNKKKLNFKLKNSKFKKKIIYLVYDQEPKEIQQVFENDNEAEKSSKYMQIYKICKRGLSLCCHGIY